jgi:hypothetical protein
MPKRQWRFDHEFREGRAGRPSTGQPIARVACDLGINGGTLGNWYAKGRERADGPSELSVADIDELGGCASRAPSREWNAMTSGAPWSGDCGALYRRQEHLLPRAAGGKYVLGVCQSWLYKSIKRPA